MNRHTVTPIHEIDAEARGWSTHYVPNPEREPLWLRVTVVLMALMPWVLCIGFWATVLWVFLQIAGQGGGFVA